MNDPALEQRITQICELSCTRVREIIEAWTQGQATPESNGLSLGARAQVLAELQAIMAVYDARNGACKE